MSALPKPPLRALKKNRRRPSSDIVGAPSIASLLIGAPRLTGASQSHARHWRCDIQMSLLPTPPARFETKNKVCPSDERPALASTELEFTTGPRFTGVDHSEPSKRSARSPKAIGSDWGRQPSIRARGGRSRPRRCARVMGVSIQVRDDKLYWSRLLAV